MSVPATVRLSDLLTGARPPVAGHSPVDLAGYARATQPVAAALN